MSDRRHRSTPPALPEGYQYGDATPRRSPQQWLTQERIPVDAVKYWRTFARRLYPSFAAYLQQEGVTPHHAPDLPPLCDGLEGFIYGPFRFLMSWVPDWSPNIDAGHHVVRIDTCEDGAERGRWRAPHENAAAQLKRQQRSDEGTFRVGVPNLQVGPTFKSAAHRRGDCMNSKKKRPKGY